MSNMKCPKCGKECFAEFKQEEVGYFRQIGPYRCVWCGWIEDWPDEEQCQGLPIISRTTVVRGSEKMHLNNAIIFSGEGDYGSYRRHTGVPSIRAINMALNRERCGGARWARAFVSAGDKYANNTYIGIDDQGAFTEELRTINQDIICD